MTDPAEIAKRLTKAQREHLVDRTGTARGLVQRGLLCYRWGNDPSFGYNLTPLGITVRAHLAGQAD